MTELKPVPGKYYRCNIKQAWNKKVIVADLVCVNEDDVNWRTADDNSEFDERNWDVISFDEIQKHEVRPCE